MLCAVIGLPFARVPPEPSLSNRQRASPASGYGGGVILVVAATPEELRGANGAATLGCGVGPVEAAACTARELAARSAAAVLNVGVEGARRFQEPAFVIGTEAVCCGADDARWIEL